MLNNTNLFSWSALIALFYGCLEYLGIKEAQVISLALIFLISGFISMLKYLSLGLSIRQFLVMELFSKTCLIFVPFVLAIGAKQIEALYFLVDYSFSLLILGEIFNMILSIQSIRLRRVMDDVDFYNLFITKTKKWIFEYLHLNKMNEEEKTKFDLWLEEQNRLKEEELNNKHKN